MIELLGFIVDNEINRFYLRRVQELCLCTPTLPLCFVVAVHWSLFLLLINLISTTSLLRCPHAFSQTDPAIPVKTSFIATVLISLLLCSSNTEKDRNEGREVRPGNQLHAQRQCPLPAFIKHWPLCASVRHGYCTEVCSFVCSSPTFSVAVFLLQSSVLSCHNVCLFAWKLSRGGQVEITWWKWSRNKWLSFCRQMQIITKNKLNNTCTLEK